MELKTENELMDMYVKLVETQDCAALQNYIDALHERISQFQDLIRQFNEINQ